jgi:hypothetical protein
MPTWCFKTAESSPGPASGPQWFWQIDSDETRIAILSNRFFATLEECVAHAREHGFRGDVEVPHGLTYPAVIRCDEENCPPYLLNRSRRGRSNRSTR